MIGIIGAMDDELKLYHENIKDKKSCVHNSFTFYTGKLFGKKVVFVKSGIAKVNASICTQIMISEFGVSKVIFSGVAGALNPELDLFDIVVSVDSIQHDVDGRGIGAKLGQIPFTDLKEFLADPTLVQQAMKSAKELGLKAIKGRILTGDQFITDKAKSKWLREKFKGDCVDMESAAVAQVCVMNKVPHLILRSISDKADHSAPVEFTEFCTKAAVNAYKLVKQMIGEINE